MKSFTSVVSQIKAVARRRATKAGTVSAVDVSGISRTTTGGRRGAIMRRVFADLVAEGFLVATTDQVYNRDTRHSVTVYRVAKRAAR